jgi:hypothetical protein
MSKFLIGIVALVAGLVVGAVGGASLLGGAMMGAGVATSAGMCSTVQVAVGAGVMTAEEVGAVMNRAAQDLGAAVPGDEQIVGTAAQCDEVMAQLRKAAG